MKKKYLILIVVAPVVFLIDQLSKFFISSYFVPHRPVSVLKDFFHINYVRNAGAAFGLFQGQSELLTVVALVGVAVLLLYAFLAHHRFPFTNSVFIKIALGLILGGTVGNLIDRLRFGYITDFVDVSIWPAFNGADSAIVIGIILFVYSLLTQPQFWRR